MKKITKSYRLNKLTAEILESVREKLGINSTSFIEMAVIEKYQRMDMDLEPNEQIEQMITDIQHDIELIEKRVINGK